MGKIIEVKYEPSTQDIEVYYMFSEENVPRLVKFMAGADTSDELRQIEEELAFEAEEQRFNEELDRHFES